MTADKTTILAALAAGKLTPIDAKSLLDLDERGLRAAMAQAGHDYPRRPSDGEVQAQLATAMPLLRAALKAEYRPASWALFLDDERHPPNDGRPWLIARSTAEAMALLDSNGWPEYVSFDHDLGGDDTSMVFLRRVIDRLLDEGQDLPFAWTVHSQNPIGKANIEALLNAFERSQAEQSEEPTP